MYFPPREAVQAFWSALAEQLAGALPASAGVPATLSWPQDYPAHWRQDDVLLSQTCGYPLTTTLAGQVQLVGSLAYKARGVQGIACRSQLICRAADARAELADFAGSTLAFNDVHSQSGYNALRALLASSGAQPPFFGQRVMTGSHGQSIKAVRTGAADMAAIDAVTLALWRRGNPGLATQLRVFAETASYPGLPLITALKTPPAVLAALRAALQTVCHGADYAALRAPLLISGFSPTTLQDYQVCMDMHNMALARGWREL